jgi:hypothetical protein
MHEEPRHKLTVKVLDSLRTIQGYTMAKNVGNVAGLQVAMAAPTVVSAPPPAATAPQAWEEPAPAAPFQSATVPNCAHGPMTARSGTSAKGPWKAWMCPTAKGTPGQCAPNFLNRGTPEFNNFPA